MLRQKILWRGPVLSLSRRTVIGSLMEDKLGRRALFLPKLVLRLLLFFFSHKHYIAIAIKMPFKIQAS